MTRLGRPAALSLTASAPLLVQGVAIHPSTAEDLWSIIYSIPVRYRSLAILGAGSGMRQGECFRLTVDGVDFLRRAIRVDRQLAASAPTGPAVGEPKPKLRCDRSLSQTWSPRLWPDYDDQTRRAIAEERARHSADGLRTPEAL
jgi:hypothetical protein